MVETTSHTKIGAIDAVVYALDGMKLGSTCDKPPMAWLGSGDMVRAVLRLDLDPGLASGDYNFETLFLAEDLRIRPPSGMVSWWSADGNARDIKDSNDGTLTGAFATAVVGKGFKLDGTGDFVVVSASPNLNITGDVTVDLWAKRAVFGSDTHMVSKGAFTIEVTDAPTVFVVAFDSVNRVIAGFERTDSTNVILLGPAVTDTNFRHYAYVRKGNTHKLFMDGVVVASDGFTGTPGDTSRIELTIGAARNDPSPGGITSYFGGVIDEVEIFNRALSAAEIKAIFKAGSAGKVKPKVHIALDFRSLPSAQGWTYFALNNIVPETSVFSVSNGILIQDSLVIGLTAQGSNRYDLAGVVDPLLPFTLSVTARVLRESGGGTTNSFGFAFTASTGAEAFGIGLGTSRIQDLITPGFLSTTIDNTQFHDYRLEATPGVGYNFFVDNLLVATGPPRVSGIGPNGLVLGDSTGGTNALAEVKSYTFVQPP